MTHLDADGQPPQVLHRERANDRLVAELLGVCKGIVADGAVSEGEALGLRRWVQGHPDVAIGYPGQVLADRLLEIFADGYVSPDERQELAELLNDLTGEPPEQAPPTNRTATALLDVPPPTIIFDAREFVFAGRMLYASRRQCEQEVRDRGGRVAAQVTRKTHYLVVGPIGSAAWIQSAPGTELLRAADLRQAGAPVRIVAEDVWLQAMVESA